MASEDKTKFIKVSSSDGEVFTVPLDVISLSNTLDTMIKDLGLDDGEDADPIPLSNVNADNLKMVITWCEYHKDDPPVEDDDDTGVRRTDDISAWDTEFLKVADHGTLFALILAANYLDIKGLLDVTCKTVAHMIKGKTTEELRRHFNIKNDFSEEEKAQIDRENAWCEE